MSIAIAGALLAPAAASATELLLDGGFEAATGNPTLSPNWTEADSVYGSPLCETTTTCPSFTAAHPRTGNHWAWFGSEGPPGHTASLSQTVIIPPGTAQLTYYFQNGTVIEPFDATLSVAVDGVVQETITEVAVAEAEYALHAVDLSAFADGSSHTLSFNYLNPSGGFGNMTVDDVSLDRVPVLLLSADPASLGPIPDGPGTCDGTFSNSARNVTFNASGLVGTIEDLTVTMTFSPNHTWAGDLRAELIAPGGAVTETLFSRTGARNDNGDDSDLAGPYTFSDSVPASQPSWWEAASGVDGASDIPAGSYRASEPGGTVDAGASTLITPAFKTLSSPNGIWKLRIRDGCAAQTGSISAARLQISTDGVAEISRTLTLKYSAEGKRFKGRLGPAGGCAADQKIKIFRVKPGRDPKIGSTTTNGRGAYKLAKAAKPGTYVAKAAGSTVATAGKCLPTASKKLKIP